MSKAHITPRVLNKNGTQEGEAVQADNKYSLVYLKNLLKFESILVRFTHQFKGRKTST